MARRQKESKAEVKVMNENGILTAEQVELCDKYTTMLGESMRTINKAQLKIGALLAVISEKELFRVRNYSNLLEYAQNEFMYDGSKGQLSDMINTFKAFGNMETLEVKEEYSDYSFSQLKLMRKIKAEDLEKVTTATTTRELAEIIKGYKDQKALPQKEEGTVSETTENTENTDNVSRETSKPSKVEDSGNVEPYVEFTFTLEEYVKMEPERLKSVIIDQFKLGNNVHLKFVYE